MGPPAGSERGRRAGAGLLLALAAGVPLLLALVHAAGHLGENRIAAEREAWQARLSWRADSQRSTVEAWVHEVGSDVALLASYPTVAWLAEQRTEGPFPFPVEQGAAAHLRQIFDGVLRTHGYAAAWLVDAEGAPLASSTAAPELPEGVRALTRSALTSEASRAHLLRIGGELHLVVVAPVTAGAARRGAAVLATPAARMLHETLAPPSVPSQTAETVLGLREGTEVVYVTDAPRPAPERVPATTPRLAMVAALDGESSSGLFQDRSGRTVLAATRPLSPGWGLVVQIGEAEALRAVRDERRENALVLTGSLVAAVFLALLGVRQEAASREARAARSQQRLLAMVERIDEVVFLVDGALRVREALGNVRGLYGVSHDWFKGRPAADARAPEHRAALPGLIERVRREGRATTETVHLRGDGTTVPVEVTLRHLGTDGDAEFVAVVRSLEPREAAEVRLRAVAENFPGCVCLFDRERRVLLARGQTLVGLRRTGEAVEGRPLSEALPPEVAARLEPLLERAFGGESQSAQVHVSGRVHDVRVVPLRATGGGQPDAVLAVAQDVTELQQALEKHGRLATAIEQTQEMIVITDREGRIEYVNPSFERTTGYTAAEVLGHRTSVLRSGVHPPSFYRAMWDTLGRGEVWSGHLVNRRKDGTLYDEDMVISPIRDASGQVTNFAAVKRDVSARLQLERELLQAQKMESVGRLAGGVAHDFNNMLSVILGYADMGRRGLHPEDPLHARLGEIVRAAERATSLTRQLLAFSRKQVLQPRVVDLGELVRGLAKMLGRLLGEHILLECHAPAQPVRVLVDPGQMEQVLLNLAVNARDAMPSGGQLAVVLEAADGHAKLRVSDNGVGMDEPTLARAFEPFFTTKPVGQGTGLGLSTVYGIVKQSGGQIHVQSEPGRGTTFTVELPLAEGATETAAVAAPATRVRAQGTVLLTEDDEALRAIAAEALGEAGYDVVQAANAGEALLIAGDPSLQVDVLVTDVVMPRVGGRQLAARLREQRPTLPVLFTSGFTDDTTFVEALGLGTAFLQKPFTAEELVAATTRLASRST